jgi:stage III sporulation protein AG
MNEWFRRWIKSLLKGPEDTGSADGINFGRRNSTGAGGPPGQAGRSSGSSPFGNMQWLLVIGLVGVGLMIITSFISVEREVMPIQEQSPEVEQAAFTNKNPDEPLTIADYEEMYEAELREILQEIVGVGAVSVMVNIDSTEETVLSINESTRQSNSNEKDSQGGSRQTTEITKDGQVVIYSAEKGEQPIVIKKIKPRVRGVLVVAKGADNIEVKKMLLEAVHKSLSVDYLRISVLAKKH